MQAFPKEGCIVSKIIKFPPRQRKSLRHRRLTRASGAAFRVESKPRHTVWVRIHPSRRYPLVDENLLYGHIGFLVRKLGGYQLAKGFTLDVVRRGKWHPLPHPVRPALLKEFLIAVDCYCEQGYVEVDIDGVVMARSKAA